MEKLACACAGEVPSWALATVKAEHVGALLDTAAAAAGALTGAATEIKSGAAEGDETAGPLPSTGVDTDGAARLDAANGDDAAGVPTSRDAEAVGCGAAGVAPGRGAEALAAPHAQQASAELAERGGGGEQVGGALVAGLEVLQGFDAGSGALAEPPVPGEPVTLAGAGFGGFVQPDSSALRALDEAMQSAGAEGRQNDDAMDLG